jgi:ferric-dicitrate binding protein FerR (iron transport regulator)
MSGDERLRELGRSLPAAEPGQLALKRLRARVLRDVTNGVASRSPPRSRVVIAASLAIALVAIVGWVVAEVESRPQIVTAAASFAPASLAGSVTPEVGAVWSQTRGEGVEKVVLVTGTLQVHVRPQSPGERFLVQLPDGELEVRGTTFHVTALEGSTRRVDVDEGTVLLRLRGSAERSLGPSARWSAAESSAPSS